MNARDPNLPLQADEATALAAYAERSWDEQIVPAMTDYIAIPAKSPMFDADWHSHGYLERVVRDTATWIEGRKLPGLKLEVLRQDQAGIEVLSSRVARGVHRMMQSFMTFYPACSSKPSASGAARVRIRGKLVRNSPTRAKIITPILKFPSKTASMV